MDRNRESARHVLQKSNGDTNSSHQWYICEGLGRTNMKEKVLERVFKYRERLLEMEESGLLGDALTYQRDERENNWICGIK
jgi:hypothetical protein